MTDEEFDRELRELEDAEDFFDYFEIDYDRSVVQVSRLHILQRFHDYLAGVEEMPVDTAQRRALYADLLSGAYQDFVTSDALTEKVFRVFHIHAPQMATVPVTDLSNRLPHAS
jgi:nitrogenase-stabilizing/protective protein